MASINRIWFPTRPAMLAAWSVGSLAMGGSLDCEVLASTIVIDFEELPLESAEYANGSDGLGGFSSQGAFFYNRYLAFGESGYWEGWAYSRATDVETPSWTNQFSSISGKGADDSSQYAIAFSAADANFAAIDVRSPRVDLPSGSEPESVSVNNTTYAALIMRDGDPNHFSAQFGGEDGLAPDWFLLRIDGLDALGNIVASVEHYLADYRNLDGGADVIQTDWQQVGLDSLAGLGVRALDFRLDSSDANHGGDGSAAGILTPAYVAIDNLVLSNVLPVSADFDENGHVDQADLNAWQSHWGQLATGGVEFGDANGNGRVEGDDFLIWQRTFGAEGNTRAFGSRIPEPGTGLLALTWGAIGATATSRRTRRRPDAVFKRFAAWGSRHRGPRRQRLGDVAGVCRILSWMGCLGMACLGLGCLGVLATATCTAGPYVDRGVTPDEASYWADHVLEGSYRPARGAAAPFSTPTHALGAVDGAVVSLGDLDQDAIDRGVAPGSITLGFQRPLYDGPGWDLAVFENGFLFDAPNDRFRFAELAYVEVSSNGRDFARFPSVSLTEERFEPFGPQFAGIDPTDLFNLAGKHGGAGTQFDLANLADEPLVLSGVVQTQWIRYVRVIDIAGSASIADPLVQIGGTPAFADSEGRVILDAWDTSIDAFSNPPIAVNAGFDLDAIGARYMVPELGAGALSSVAWLLFCGMRKRRFRPVAGWLN